MSGRGFDPTRVNLGLGFRRVWARVTCVRRYGGLPRLSAHDTFGRRASSVRSLAKVADADGASHSTRYRPPSTSLLPGWLKRRRTARRGVSRRSDYKEPLHSLESTATYHRIRKSSAPSDLLASFPLLPLSVASTARLALHSRLRPIRLHARETPPPIRIGKASSA